MSTELSVVVSILGTWLVAHIYYRRQMATVRAEWRKEWAENGIRMLLEQLHRAGVISKEQLENAKVKATRGLISFAGLEVPDPPADPYGRDVRQRSMLGGGRIALMHPDDRLHLEDVARVIVEGEDWHEVMPGTLRLVGKRSTEGKVEASFRWTGPDGKERTYPASRIWGFQLR